MTANFIFLFALGPTPSACHRLTPFGGDSCLYGVELVFLRGRGPTPAACRRFAPLAPVVRNDYPLAERLWNRQSTSIR
jgi:hypothetical protein